MLMLMSSSHRRCHFSETVISSVVMRLHRAFLTFSYFAAVATVAEDAIGSISDLKYDENGKLAKHTGE
jgi:predicted pyridoxine 5'-phosphate oxidase superfamily flavin-nucleotide-binding protein